jgi:nondiscriminating glutamyl-tRNA synthetase
VTPYPVPDNVLMRVRFAPSPTGHLHVGNARTALFNWLLARGQGGTFVLRLEDTDDVRSTVASADGIVEDLRWLGLTWDEGPDVGGAFGPYRQTERLGHYRAHAERLMAGGHAYHCFCSPADLEAQREVALREGRTPQYAGTCRDIDPASARARVEGGEPAAIRFRVPPKDAVTFTDLVRGPITTDIAMIGDFVLIRQNGVPAYNFAVVVDDLEMAITLVVRAASCRKRWSTTWRCSGGHRGRVRNCCRQPSSRVASAWRTSPGAPACSIPTSSPG